MKTLRPDEGHRLPAGPSLRPVSFVARGRLTLPDEIVVEVGRGVDPPNRCRPAAAGRAPRLEGHRPGLDVGPPA